MTWKTLNILELLGDYGLKFSQVNSGTLDHIDQDIVCHFENFVRRVPRIEKCPEGSDVRKNVSQRPTPKWVDEVQHNVRDGGRFWGWGLLSADASSVR